jgi:hypothetical protein
LRSLKEFLPQSYAKVKGIEKKVFAEQKKHVGLSELDAKVQYTKTARSLKTYGVTFFLVKVRYQETDSGGFGREGEGTVLHASR